MIQIEREAPTGEDVRLMLSEHLIEMLAISPVESVHALDARELCRPEISFWTAREHGVLLGCGALKQLTAQHGEIKSLRTAAEVRGRGVAALLLSRIVDEARRDNVETLRLETGTEDFFNPARRLYYRLGFTECEPFADYVLDPNSVYMGLRL